MKKRNAKVFALFMSVAMAMPNVAAAMPVYAAPEAEEIEAEAEEDVEEVEVDEVEVEEETEAETDDNEIVTAQISCGTNVTYEISNEKGVKVLTLRATGHGVMNDYSKTNPAPWAKDSFTEVKVTGDLENIGDYAFYGCSSLKKVTLWKTMITIGESAFEDCTALEEVGFNDMTDIQIQTYKRAAFKNCTALKEMDFSGHAVVVDDEVFYNCKNYKPGNMEEFPETLVRIGEAAFWNCQKIESLIIPYSLKVIDGGYDTAMFGSTDDAFNDQGGVLSIEGKRGAFTGCSGLTSVKFNVQDAGSGMEGVEKIGDFAFYGCTSLGDIEIVGTVRKLGDYAFAHCTNASSATVQNYIPDYDANYLSDAELADWLKDGRLNKDEAGKWTRSQDGLKLYGTFANCESMTEVYLGTESKIDKGVYYSDIVEIDDLAFYECYLLNKVVLSRDKMPCTRIGKSAFYRCYELAEIDMPTTTMGSEIDDDAFRDCTKLDDVIVPEGVVRIGRNAFADCTGMTNIYLPKSLNDGDYTNKGIDDYAFCPTNGDAGLKTLRLMDLYFGGTEAEWKTLQENEIGEENKIITNNDLASFKASKYYESDPYNEMATGIDAVYDEEEGKFVISWDSLTREVNGRTYSPKAYEVYVNHVSSSTLDQQWAAEKTPAWEKLPNTTTNSKTYLVKNITPGDEYHFRVRPVWADGAARLTDAEECTAKIPSEQDKIAIESLKIDQAAYEVIAGKTITISVAATPSNANTSVLGWTSTNKDVATVSGKGTEVTINGLKEGTSIITVSDNNGHEASCEIIVLNKSAIQVESLKMDQTKLTIEAGKTGTLSFTVNPTNASATNYYWETSNPKIATVEATESPKIATIRAIAEGEVTITAYSANGKETTCVVTIKKGSGKTTSGNTFSKAEAAKGVSIDSTHNMKLELDAKGNFTGATITDSKGDVDESVDSYLANIVTEYNDDGTPKTFYTLVFTDGKWDTSYDSQTKGAYNYNGVDYFVAGGVVNQNANGLQYTGEAEGWKFLAAGHVVTGNEGLVMYNGEWFWIDDKGSCDDTYAAIVKWNGANFLVHGGRLRTDYTGFTYDPQKKTDWYHITNGQVWGEGTITDISIEGGTITRNVKNGKVQ